MKQQADELWSRVEREVQELRQRTQDESARILQDADKRAEEIVRMANDRLSEAEARAQEILQQTRDSKNWLPTVKGSEALRTLRDTAQDVARRQLPELIKLLSQTNPQDVDLSVTSVGTFSNEEINQVARAFDDVHREAVRLAAEQALLRGNVNAMFTNLSRRSQRLIQRQLSLISELESREADPDLRDALFKLDHLATRMRRNGENLLVLAGEEPGRRWTRPVPLVNVLRAAASEVEQYERIELASVPTTEVAYRVVNDLVHLLAELLENATSFSPPQTKVKVTGHALPDGRMLIEIHDTGIGLTPRTSPRSTSGWRRRPPWTSRSPAAWVCSWPDIWRNATASASSCAPPTPVVRPRWSCCLVMWWRQLLRPAGPDGMRSSFRRALVRSDDPAAVVGDGSAQADHGDHREDLGRALGKKV